MSDKIFNRIADLIEDIKEIVTSRSRISSPVVGVVLAEIYLPEGEEEKAITLLAIKLAELEVLDAQIILAIMDDDDDRYARSLQRQTKDITRRLKAGVNRH